MKEYEYNYLTEEEENGALYVEQLNSEKFENYKDSWIEEHLEKTNKALERRKNKIKKNKKLRKIINDIGDSSAIHLSKNKKYIVNHRIPRKRLNKKFANRGARRKLKLYEDYNNIKGNLYKKISTI